MANEVEITVRSRDQTGQGFGSADKKARGLGNTLQRVGAAAGGFLAGSLVTGGLAALSNGISGVIAEGREAEVVGKTTAQVIKATGGAAKVTAEQVGALSERLSEKAGVDDEVIQTGANLLLTFKNVKNEVGDGNKVFDRATAAALDLSEAGFGSMDSSSKMLGKALNDPIKGITALSRAGVTFTQQQKDKIASLVEEGKTLQAQKMILKEVETQVGGVAAANATAGEKATVAWGNIQEAIASRLLPVLDRLANVFLEKIVPVINDKVLPAVDRFAKWASENTGVIKVLAGVIGGALVVALAAYTVAAASAAVATIAATWPILLIIAAIAALAVGIFYLVKNWDKVWSKVKEIAAAAGEWIVGVLKAAWNAVVSAVKWVARLVVSIWRAHINTLTGIFRAIVAAAKWVGRLLVSVWRAHINTLTAIFRRFVSGAKAVWRGLSALVSWARSVFARVLSAVRSKLNSVVSFVRSIPGRIRRALGSTSRLLYNAGVNVVRGLINGIRYMAGAAVSAARGVVSNAVQGAKALLGIRSPSKVAADEIGKPIGQGVVVGLNKARGMVAAAGASMAGAAIPGTTTGVRAVGGGGTTVLEIRSGGSRLDDVLVEVLQRAVKARGGNVQLVLGKG